MHTLAYMKDWTGLRASSCRSLLNECQSSHFDESRVDCLHSELLDFGIKTGEDKTWTPGPWTTSLDRVHGPPLWTGSIDPLFFIPQKIEKRKKNRRHTTHIASLLFFNCVRYFVSHAIDHFKLRPRKRFSLPQVKAKH